MRDDSFKPEQMYQRLMGAISAVGKQHFSPETEQEIKVTIRPDKSVLPAKFIADPLNVGGYKAHPVTIRALRKDIFTAGDELFEDLEQWSICTSCNKSLDLQFWIFCPYCEGKLD